MVEAKFQPLVDEVSSLRTVNDSAIALIDGMVEAVRAAQDDPDEIAEVLAGFEAERNRLAAAVTANTPGGGGGTGGGGETGGGETGGPTPPVSG